MKRKLYVPIRMSQAERDLIDAVGKKASLFSRSETIRQAVRDLAEKYGIKIKPPKE